MVVSKNLKDRKELEKQGFFGAKSKILKHVTGKKYYKNLIGFGVSVEILIKQVKFAFSNMHSNFCGYLLIQLILALFKMCLNSSGIAVRVYRTFGNSTVLLMSSLAVWFIVTICDLWTVNGLAEVSILWELESLCFMQYSLSKKKVLIRRL